MNRIYKCPICGSSYNSLIDMYTCAQACEQKEIEKETKKKALEKQKNIDLEKIKKNCQSLISEVEEYNKKYNEHLTFNCYSPSLSFKNIKDKNLEELLTALFD